MAVVFMAYNWPLDGAFSSGLKNKKQKKQGNQKTTFYSEELSKKDNLRRILE